MKLGVTLIRGGIENAYLVKGDSIALVDTLAPKGYARIEKGLAAQGLKVGDIDFILITHHHVDHVGNLARLREESGAVVIAGEEDAPFIEGTSTPPAVSDLNRVGRMLGRLPESWLRGYQRFRHAQVDRTVKEGETIDELGLEVLALPGHTPGGIGFLDREGRRAFVGDLVSNFFGRAGLPVLSASCSLEGIVASQEMLADLDLETAYPGHGRIIGPGASGVIADCIGKKRSKLMR